MARKSMKRLAGAPCPRVIARALDLVAEPIAKLGVNLETALTDRRTHRGANIGGARTELNHRMDARASDIRDNAAPSGMQRAGDFALRIDQQDRHAVGGKYSQHHARFRSDDPITRRPQPCRIASRGVNDVAMHLVQARDELESRHFAAQALPVGIDGALVVADPIGKIHRSERTGADAAGAADEAVADRRVGPRADDFDGARVAQKFCVIAHLKISYTSRVSAKITRSG